MIEVENLSKRYGDKLAVDALSFVVQPGMVTGFLGPSGAGQSTTMRMIAGLDAPTTGRFTVNGRRHVSTPAPMAELGEPFVLDVAGERLSTAASVAVPASAFLASARCQARSASRREAKVPAEPRRPVTP